jgi:hypothetical protein
LEEKEETRRLEKGRKGKNVQGGRRREGDVTLSISIE